MESSSKFYKNVFKRWICGLYQVLQDLSRSLNGIHFCISIFLGLIGVCTELVVCYCYLDVVLNFFNNRVVDFVLVDWVIYNYLTFRLRFNLLPTIP